MLGCAHLCQLLSLIARHYQAAKVWVVCQVIFEEQRCLENHGHAAQQGGVRQIPNTPRFVVHNKLAVPTHCAFSRVVSAVAQGWCVCSTAIASPGRYLWIRLSKQNTRVFSHTCC